jgi:prepilin-type N-terminal cleavage/methylation domain-containing protein
MKGFRGLRGFTLTEILVAIAILIALAALLWPVLASAKNRAKESKCWSNLHQMHIALAIYREENAKVPYGGAATMGLPPYLDAAIPRSILDKLKICDGVGPEPFLPARYVVMWLGMDSESSPWAKYARKYEEATVCMVDPNHRNEGKPRVSEFYRQYAIGLRLDGSIFSVTRMGSPGSFDFWDPANGGRSHDN